MLRRTFLKMLPAPLFVLRPLVLLRTFNMTLAISTCERVFPISSKMGYHVIITDDNRPDLGSGAQQVMDITKTKSIPEGQAPTTEDRDAVIRDIQEIIDQYKKDMTQYNLSGYVNSVTYVQNNLNLT